YGIADLRGKTDRDVIAAMLSVADSRFQNELLRHAKDAGKIEKDFEIPRERRDNSPDRIERALAPARSAGLIDPFPFGTDFTLTEQCLIPALKRLASASPIQLAGIMLCGLVPGMHAADTGGCLARMGLERPKGFLESIYAALLRGSLQIRQ